MGPGSAPGAGSGPASWPGRGGYLLTRDSRGPWPAPVRENERTRLARVSRLASTFVLDQSGEQGTGRAGWTERLAALLPGKQAGAVEAYPEHAGTDRDLEEARSAVGRLIAESAARVHTDERLAGRLARLGSILGTEIATAADARPPIDTVLGPDVRVCFTGTAVDTRGRFLDRPDLEDLAERNGLRAVGNVTKTRCDVLVAADLATQSGKARRAAEWGKPVYSVAEFLAWCGEA